MPLREEMRFLGFLGSSPEDDGFVLAADSETNQTSFEPIESLSHDYASDTMNIFSARSLGRRVQGYYVARSNGGVVGEVDFVLPLHSDDVEEV